MGRSLVSYASFFWAMRFGFLPCNSSTFTNSVYDMALPNSRQIRRNGKSENPSIGDNIRSP